MNTNQPLSGQHLFEIRILPESDPPSVIFSIGDSQASMPPEMAILIGQKFIEAGRDVQRLAAQSVEVEIIEDDEWNKEEDLKRLDLR